MLSVNTAIGRSSAIAVAALALMLLAGCSSTAVSSGHPTPPTSTVEAKSEAPRKPFGKLAKGMPATQVRELLGLPAEVTPSVTAGVKSEIWTYRESYPGKTQSVPGEMQEIPYVDPISGEMRMIKQPILRTEITRIAETTELLLIEGKLIEWKQRREARRGYF